MKCIYCGEEMEYTGSYGNNWDMPQEEYYSCLYCKAEATQVHNTVYWTEGNIKEKTTKDKILEIVKTINTKYPNSIKLGIVNDIATFTFKDDEFSESVQVLGKEIDTLKEDLMDWI